MILLSGYRGWNTVDFMAFEPRIGNHVLLPRRFAAAREMEKRWLLALDLAEHKTGWLFWPVGEIGQPQVLRLRTKDGTTEEAAAKLACWLRDLFDQREPWLVCMEHFLPAGAAAGRTMDTVREGQIAMAYVVRAISAAYSVPVRSPYPATVRRHFCGQSSAAPKRPRGYKRSDKEAAQDRQETKAMVIKRAQLLGYIPKDCQDDNLADAASLHSFGSAYFGGKHAGPLALFGEERGEHEAGSR
jgi:hypothetical protein